MRGKLGQILLAICVLSFTLCLSRPLAAQVAGAIVTGAVTDAQGGAVASAKVSARNVQTNGLPKPPPMSMEPIAFSTWFPRIMKSRHPPPDSAPRWPKLP